MESYDAEQVAMVMRLQREAGGNTAEVLDRVAETIRGRMELRRLVQVLTAQARISLDPHQPPDLPVRAMFTGGDYLDPLTTLIGRIAFVVGAVMVHRLAGSRRSRKWTCEMDITLIALAGVLLLGAGIAILVVNLGRNRGSNMTIEQIGTYGYVAESAGGPRSMEDVGRSTPSPAGSATSPRSERHAVARRRSATSCLGGHVQHEPAQVLGYQVLVAIAFALLVFCLVPAMGGSIVFAVAAAAAVGGWFAPPYYINIKKRQRFTKIDRQMPDMIDLLVVTIEAGLGILASMRVASETMSDPLGQELRLTLQEQRMGLTVQQAIESLGRRADAPNVRIFVRSLTQGERLGVSIASTMRNLSLEMRKRRKAMAEERAQKMPIKMLFPLIFFIFPAMFIVLLVPMAINIVDALG